MNLVWCERLSRVKMWNGMRPSKCFFWRLDQSFLEKCAKSFFSPPCLRRKPNLEIHQPSFTFYIIQIISCFRTISKSSRLTIQLSDTSGLDLAAKNKNVSQNFTADRPRRNIGKRKDYHAGKKKSPGCFSCDHHKE